MIVLIKLILGHLIGDFLFQPDSWVKAKENKKLRAWQLYMHTFIHFSLIMLLIWDIRFLEWAFLIAGTHFITDVLKSLMQNEKTKRTWFFADQLVHLIIVILVSVLSQNLQFTLDALDYEYYLLLITFVYALTQPVSVVIRSVIARWTPATNKNNTDSLENAGNVIGIMERLFVFTFVITGHWEAIGFLIAAKSIFRFGDLKDSKERILTEYVLIGTLLSFGIALLAGIIFQTLTIGYIVE